MSRTRVPGVLAPWLTGLILFSLLAGGATTYLARPRQLSPIPQSVLDARRESTTASAQAVTRSLNGGLTSLSEIATVVDESLKQRNQALLDPFRARRWKSLYVLDQTTGTVVAQVGESAQPSVLGEPLPKEAGMRTAQVGTATEVVQYTPVGKPAEAKYLLVGHHDVRRLRDLLTPAAADGTWLVDRSGAVIEGVGTGEPPQAFVPPAPAPGESVAGSHARRLGSQLEVFAWASLTGGGPATALDWTVVSVKPVTDVTMATDDTRRRGVTAGGTLAALTAVVFGALYLVVLRPIRQLGQVIVGTRSPERGPSHGEAGHIARTVAQARRTTSGRPDHETVAGRR
ncbi:hypothetical protein [Lentzea aerocolonigenes]|uniref:hypothetical protein n=1 Tax=Lentzea aerocolonigenes TaxID=68170 RepID=UPI0004C37698|nr:hypothetical protein [Lentzea aerocolonigenes]MCP2242281.1 hypothetical protein [Lentzea aerocolonigenes]